jgi:hypothetical protein
MFPSKSKCKENLVANSQCQETEPHPATTSPSRTESSLPLPSTNTSFSSQPDVSKTDTPKTPLNPQDHPKPQKNYRSDSIAVASTDASGAEPTPDATGGSPRLALSSPARAAIAFPHEESPDIIKPLYDPSYPHDALRLPIAFTPAHKEVDENGDDKPPGREPVDEIGDDDVVGGGSNINDKFGSLTDSVASLFVFHAFYGGELSVPGFEKSMEVKQCAAIDIANVDRLFGL